MYNLNWWKISKLELINGEKWKIKIRQQKLLQKELQNKCFNKGQGTRFLFLKDIPFIGQINNKTKASRQLCWPLSLVLFSFIDIELDLLILNNFDMFTNTIDKANRLLEARCTLNCFESLWACLLIICFKHYEPFHKNLRNCIKHDWQKMHSFESEQKSL